MNPLKILVYRPGVDFTVPEGILQHPICIPAEPSQEWLAAHGAALTADPDEADWIVFPLELCQFISRFGYMRIRDFLDTLPHFPAHEDKHVFYESGDLDNPVGIGSVIFKTSVDRHRRDVGCVVFPYPVHDFVLPHSPQTDFSAVRFDVSFVGSVQHPVRIPVMFSLVHEPGLEAFVETPEERDVTKSSWYYLPEGDRKRGMEDRYVESLKLSLTVLCPRGIGHICFRFYETMYMARIPVLVDDLGGLPFEDEIDYDSFCLRIPEDSAREAGRIVKEWLASKTPAQLKLMCLTARQVWEKYFRNDGRAAQMFRVLRRMSGPRPGVWTERPHELAAEATPRRVRRPEAVEPLIVDPPGLGRNGQFWATQDVELCEVPGRAGWIEANGVAGPLRVEDMEKLFEAGGDLPQDGVAVVLGPIQGLTAVLLASGALGSLRLDATVYALADQVDQALAPNLASAGIEHMVRTLSVPPRQGAGLFRDHSVDLLLVERHGLSAGEVPALRGVWDRTLKPGARVIVNSVSGE
jgi:hypothetical protein